MENQKAHSHPGSTAFSNVIYIIFVILFIGQKVNQKVLNLVSYFCRMIFITKIHLHLNAEREIQSLVCTAHI